MPGERTYVSENNTARRRLKNLVDRSTDADLSRSLGGGWTVAVALAHLAFWDRRALGVLQRWERGEAPGPVDADLLNESLLPEWLALAPRDAARLAVAAAEAVDQGAEAASADLVEKIHASGERRRLARAVHRAEHLDQIERALATSARAAGPPR